MKKSVGWIVGLGLVLGVLLFSDWFFEGATTVHRDRFPEGTATTPLPAGSTAPDFALPDRSGRSHSLHELVTGDTLLVFTCGCANCRDLMTYLGILRRRRPAGFPAVLNVTTMPNTMEEAWYRDTHLPQTILYEAKEGPVMRLYAGHPCPRFYRLDPRGSIRWVSPPPADAGTVVRLGGIVAEELGFRGADAVVAGSAAEAEKKREGDR